MKRICCVVLALLVSVSAAADVYCIGLIEDYHVTKAGYVYMDGVWNGSDESQRLCALSGAFDGVSADTCKAWLSTVISAQMANREVRLLYVGLSSCSAATLGTNASTVKSPEYIRVY